MRVNIQENIDRIAQLGVLDVLLQDRTTGGHILWATDAYADLGPEYSAASEIREEQISGENSGLIMARSGKAAEEQAERTKSHAEVFTPAWICNQMNNYCDAEWFGRPDVFNRHEGTSWTTNEDMIEFPWGKTWEDYIDSKRLEITCGEAPYIASRYDAATGKMIPVKDRIGILDRKLRVVSEHASSSRLWYKYALRAMKSVYGYEFQGDNLFIGRINLMLTVIEHFEERYGFPLTETRVRELAEVISWNLWQMDGLTDCVPFDDPPEERPGLEYDTSGFAEFWGEESPPIKQKPSRLSLIRDWAEDEEYTFRSIKGEELP